MEVLWLRVAAVLYAASAVAIFPAVIGGRERWRRSTVHLAGMGFFFHFVSAVEMLVAAHHWMPVGTREVESLFGLLLAVVFLLIWWLYDAMALGLFVLPAVFFAVLAPAIHASGPIFNSNGVRMGWLVVHIAALMLAYVALGFSLLGSVLYLVAERKLKSKSLPGEDSWWVVMDWLPPLANLERIAHVSLLCGLPAMSVGLLIGAVLAQETSYGMSYFEDPKVLASFFLWAVYVFMLVARSLMGLRGRRAAYLSGAVFFIMLVVLAANFFSQVHGYGLR